MEMIDEVTADLLYDHTSLYLRPPTKGRGMHSLNLIVGFYFINASGIAVLSVVLLDDSGQYQPFCPGVVMPAIVTEWSSASFKYMMDQVTSSSERTDGPSVCVYIWEKGNIGFSDLRSLLMKCFNHSIIDCLLELFLLPSPIATVFEEDDEEDYDDISMLEEPFDDTPMTPPPGIPITPIRRQTSQPVRSRHDTFSIIKAVEDAIGTPPDYNVAVEGQIAGLQVIHFCYVNTFFLSLAVYPVFKY